jgi:enamine deaminase RidA (YjgF/YER057c/UK114 family)
MTVRKPASASRAPAARPIPDAPPVTIATFASTLRSSHYPAEKSEPFVLPVGPFLSAEVTTEIDNRLAELGLELPAPAVPGANYLPFVRTGNLVFVTGQLAQWNGERRFIGKLGREFSVEDGQQAARLCALNVLAQLRVALDGDLDRVVQCVRIAGYVNSMPEFHGQSQVINGASDTFIAVFGERGRHTRIAVGVAALPYDVAVEVEASF